MTDPLKYPFERLDAYRVAMELMEVVAKSARASCLREIAAFDLADSRLIQQAHSLLHRLTLMLTRPIAYWTRA